MVGRSPIREETDSPSHFDSDPMTSNHSSKKTSGSGVYSLRATVRPALGVAKEYIYRLFDAAVISNSLPFLSSQQQLNGRLTGGITGWGRALRGH